MNFDRKVFILDVNDILPNRFQPRIKFNEESINELCNSIREHGVIQPIVVRKMGDKFEIIAGERRFKASLLAGKNTIPAIVTELNDKDSAEIALIENVQRKDLTPIEEAISYKKILDMGYLTQDELANKLGKTQSTVANKLRLLNLTDDVQEALLDGKISERHARSILRLPSANMQKEMLNKVIIERLTVRKVDEEINKILKGEIEEIDKKINETLVPFISNEKVNFMTTPYYEKQENNEVVPNFKGQEETIIPSFDLKDLENKDEEPIVIIEEEKNMNDNNQFNNQNDFNPFDMTSTNIDDSMPSSTPIQTSPQLGNTYQSNNDFVDINKNNSIEEPVLKSNEDTNYKNPGFMDIEKIKNEAVDIDFTNKSYENNNSQSNYTYTNPSETNIANDFISTNDYSNIGDNQNRNNNITTTTEFDNMDFGFSNQENLLKERDYARRPVVEEQYVPGKFFNLPIQEEKDKNEEVELDTNPFNININNDDNNYTLNITEEQKLKTIDDIKHFSEEPKDFTVPIVEDYVKPLMNNEPENTYNPVNEFNMPSFINNEDDIKPIAEPINPVKEEITNQDVINDNTFEKPFVELNKESVSFNHQSFVPTDKDINTAMLAIKECESKLKRLGFNVNTEDFDFENMYQIMFRIEK